MRLTMHKKIIATIGVLILAAVGLIIAISSSNKNENNIVENITNEVIVNTVENSVATKEIPKLTEEDEQALEVQEAALEAEGFERQGEVAYNGSKSLPNVSLGAYQGLTYYSQADKRWASHMYSAINDRSQTMLTSGCGPTAAAMVVSSIKGTITPDKMRRPFCPVWLPFNE